MVCCENTPVVNAEDESMDDNGNEDTPIDLIADPLVVWRSCPLCIRGSGRLCQINPLASTEACEGTTFNH